MKRRHLLGVISATSLTALLGCDAGKQGQKAASTSFRNVDITGADYARDFALPDVQGQLRTLADFKGKVTVVFFGFTQCPDVCPSTLVELAQIKKSLGADGERLQAVFITVDPERDTPEILKAYMASFDPSFVALRGTPEQTLATAKAFKVYFAKSPGKTEGSYSMDHTAASYVFDTQGRVRLFARYGQPSDGLMADLKALLAGA